MAETQNWTSWWKASTMICATAATFCQGMGPLALGPQFPFYIESFHSNLTDVVQFTGIAILVLGFSNFICECPGILARIQYRC